MDHSAIREIGAMAVQAQRANVIAAEAGGIPAVVIRKTQTLLKTEDLQAGRSRFRGNFRTSVLGAFAGYVSTNQPVDEKVPVFVEPKGASATAFLNLGDPDSPGHADWRATLSMEQTAGYAALRAQDGKTVNQKQLSDWIEDWAPFLRAQMTIDSDPVPISHAITAIRNLTIKASEETSHAITDFAARRSSMAEIEAKSANGIPSHLRFTVSPYPGFTERSIALRVSVNTGGDKPTLTLRIVGRELLEESIAAELVDSLSGLMEGHPITIGTFNP